MMLGLATHEPHFSLLREEVRFGRKSQRRQTSPDTVTFHLLHLSIMREYIDFEFLPIKVTHSTITMCFSASETRGKIYHSGVSMHKKWFIQYTIHVYWEFFVLNVTHVRKFRCVKYCSFCLICKFFYSYNMDKHLEGPGTGVHVFTSCFSPPGQAFVWLWPGAYYWRLDSDGLSSWKWFHPTPTQHAHQPCKLAASTYVNAMQLPAGKIYLSIWSS